jgi:hypothetical protein
VRPAAGSAQYEAEVWPERCPRNGKGRIEAGACGSASTAHGAVVLCRAGGVGDAVRCRASPRPGKPILRCRGATTGRTGDNESDCDGSCAQPIPPNACKPDCHGVSAGQSWCLNVQCTNFVAQERTPRNGAATTSGSRTSSVTRHRARCSTPRTASTSAPRNSPRSKSAAENFGEIVILLVILGPGAVVTKRP